MIDVRVVRYNAVAMTLHWLIAALLISNILLAWYFNTLQGPARGLPMGYHKSIGISVLLLSLLRLAWRFMAPPPPMPRSLAPWERIAANTVYVLFYVVMIGMPLSGWAMSSVGTRPIIIWGAIHWPSIGPLTTLPAAQVKPTHELFETTHGLLAKLAYALIVLHVLAALRHQFLKRDAVVSRMVPFIKRPA